VILLVLFKERPVDEIRRSNQQEGFCEFFERAARGRRLPVPIQNEKESARDDLAVSFFSSSLHKGIS
jgi:hypothetical protein